MNLPLGVFALALTWWKMPKLEPETTLPLDWVGFGLSGFGLGLSMLGLTTAGRDMFTAWQVVAMIISGLLLLVAYVFYALRATVTNSRLAVVALSDLSIIDHRR